MMQTSSSNRTMALYAYCGTSTRVEPGDPIEDVVLKDDDAYDDAELALQQAMEGGPLQPNNDLTPEQKLDMAVVMAESVAELHGNREGVIVNHDLALGQWLTSKKDGLLKMNDFNKAHVLFWNEDEQRYCKFWSSQWGVSRAPEEMKGGYIDGSADVLTFGKVLYKVLTGYRPYRHVSYDEACELIRKGQYPEIDPRYRSRSYIEGRLVDIMEQMWVYKAEDRPSIFDVLVHLRETARVAASTANAKAATVATTAATTAANATVTAEKMNATSSDAPVGHSKGQE